MKMTSMTSIGSDKKEVAAVRDDAGRRSWRGSAPLFGLAILVIVLSILSPVFLTPDNIWNIARQATVNALLAVGMLLTIITAGIDLSVGSVLALSMSVLALRWPSSWTSTRSSRWLAGLAVGLGMGMINGLLLTRLHLPHPFIATLGTMNIARGLALIITGAAPISGFDRAGAPQVLVAGRGLARHDPGRVHRRDHRLRRSSTCCCPTPPWAGTSMRSAATRRRRGSPASTSTGRLLIVYSLSGLMAGMAALMLAGRTNSGYPTAATGAELDAIAAVIIGGASFAGGIRHGLGHSHRRRADRGAAQRPGAAARCRPSGRSSRSAW